LFVCIRCWRLWRKERRRKKSFASAGIAERRHTQIAWWLPQWLPVLPDIVKSTPWWANTESPLVRSRNINVSGVRPSVRPSSLPVCLAGSCYYAAGERERAGDTLSQAITSRYF
jgi:hypothetical protein